MMTIPSLRNYSCILTDGSQPKVETASVRGRVVGQLSVHGVYFFAHSGRMWRFRWEPAREWLRNDSHAQWIFADHEYVDIDDEKYTNYV